MTTVNPEIDAPTSKSDIIKRHANLAVGERLTQIALGMSASSPESLKARLGTPIIALLERRFRVEQEAARADVDDQTLEAADNLATSRLYELLDQAIDHLSSRRPRRKS
jgi:hypothetical protein